MTKFAVVQNAESNKIKVVVDGECEDGWEPVHTELPTKKVADILARGTAENLGYSIEVTK